MKRKIKRLKVEDYQKISRKILCGQGIPSLSVAIKELVENSLDAKATKVQIKFCDFGYESFEVSDDGVGICQSDMENICKGSYTSKIDNFGDILKGPTSFGFRGEALNNLCALSGKLSSHGDNISGVSVTSSPDETGFGWTSQFSTQGEAMYAQRKSKQRGTQVRVSNLFQNIPVRRSVFKKNRKKEFQKAIQWLQTYALITTKVSISVVNVAEKSRKKYFETKGNETLAQNITDIFSFPVDSNLRSLNLKLNLDTTKDQLNEVEGTEAISEMQNFISINGYISNPSLKDVVVSDKHRQFIFLNGKPVVYAELRRTINTCWSNAGLKGKPFFVVCVGAKKGAIDFNVSPDKKKIAFAGEKQFISTISSCLDNILVPNDMLLGSQNDDKKGKNVVQVKEEPKPLSPKHKIHDEFENRKGMGARGIDVKPGGSKDDPLQHPEVVRVADHMPKVRKLVQTNIFSMFGGNKGASDQPKVANVIPKISESKTRTLKNLPSEPSITKLKPLCGISLDNIEKAFTERLKQEQVKEKEKSRCTSVENPIAKSQALFQGDISASPSNYLRVGKNDLRDFKLVGQFNLGFILVVIKSQIFLFDQHASDEIHRFETLLNEGNVSVQHLIHPCKVDLSGIELAVLEEEGVKEMVNRLGFQYRLQDDKLFLTAVPQAFKDTFNQDDFKELIQKILGEGNIVKSNGEYSPEVFSSLYLDKHRKRFASKACRSAVMIGTSLKLCKQKEIVTNLASLRRPFNCPHGRPTFKHVLDMRECYDKRVTLLNLDKSVDPGAYTGDGTEYFRRLE
eukprot:maker-scaffold_12-snap-gene-11.21-mRNA-1 protein AED:0.47 eAED:0.47 QI:0/0/0/0.4/1/1/5/0/793